MKGVSFNNIHSFRDLNLVLAPFEESVPEIKENYVDVPGADGDIDLTRASGEVKYKDREFDLTFTSYPYDDWEKKKRQVTNLLHGLYCDIVFDRNPEYRLCGSVKVSDRKSNKMLRQIVVHCKTAPYWLKIAESVYSCSLGNSVNLCPRINEWTKEGGAIIDHDIATVSGTKIVMSPLISYNGGVLSFSAQCSAQSLRVFFWAYDSTNTLTKSNFNLTNGKRENYTPPAGCVKYKIRLQPTGSTVDDVYVSHIQIESGPVCTDYAPKDGVLITNENKAVIPTITASSAMTITDSNGNSFSISAGTHKILDISIPTGESMITASGTGTMTVRFTERAL